MNASGAPARPIRLGLLMTLALGNRTLVLNWQQELEALADSFAPTWVLIPSEVEQPWLKALPLLPTATRRMLSEWLSMKRGLARGPFDALIVNPHGFAVKHQRALARQPTFLCIDATRRQLDSFGHWYGARSAKSGPLRRLQQARQELSLRSATGLFPASKWAADSLIAEYGVEPRRVHVTPLGVDVRRWTPASGPRAPGPLRLLFIGGAFARKGGDLLLRWARSTAKRDWELHLVTTEAHEAIAGVHYHRAANNAPELIALARECDLFVLPTRADCSPIALLEAMSAGLPVVSTRVGGIPEVIVEGETGHVIEPDDYDALHSRLDALLDARDRLPAMGRAARARAVAEYDCKQIISNALDIVRAAVEQAR